MNEAQTRLELIDPAIQAAGWTKANNCQMLVEQSAGEFAPGRDRAERRDRRSDEQNRWRGMSADGFCREVPERCV